MKKESVCALSILFLLIIILILDAKVAGLLKTDKQEECIIQMAGYILFLFGVFLIRKIEKRKSSKICVEKYAARTTIAIIITSTLWANFATLTASIVLVLLDGTITQADENMYVSILGFITIVVFAPICEEIAFRGELYCILRKKLSFSLALIIVSILWAIMHLSPAKVINAFLLSILFTYVYEKSGNLKWPIIAHISNNFIGYLSVMPVVKTRYALFVKGLGNMGLIIPFVLMEFFVAITILKSIKFNK